MFVYPDYVFTQNGTVWNRIYDAGNFLNVNVTDDGAEENDFVIVTNSSQNFSLSELVRML